MRSPTTGPTPKLRAPGQHVRVGQLLEPARAPLPRLRLVGDAAPKATRTARLHELAATRERRRKPGRADRAGKVTYAWTDITYLMDKAGVSWRYYVTEGTEPDCEADEAVMCEPVTQSPTTPGIWNPLADFTDVAGRRRSSETSSRSTASTTPSHKPATAACPTSPGSSPTSKSPSTARRDLHGAGLRDDADQHDHAQPLLGQHGDLPLLGRLGRLLRPRRRRPASTRTATACACPGW